MPTIVTLELPDDLVEALNTLTDEDSGLYADTILSILSEHLLFNQAQAVDDPRALDFSDYLDNVLDPSIAHENFTISTDVPAPLTAPRSGNITFQDLCKECPTDKVLIWAKGQSEIVQRAVEHVYSAISPDDWGADWLRVKIIALAEKLPKGGKSETN